MTSSKLIPLNLLNYRLQLLSDRYNGINDLIFIHLLFPAIGLITIENFETAILGETLRKKKGNSLGDLSLRMCVNTYLGDLDYDTVQFGR
jgi:hypothetical protein